VSPNFDMHARVQGVHNMFEGVPDREWQEGEERVNKLVFIGKDLQMELLKEGFEDCLYNESDVPLRAEDADPVASA
jgi:G3E family GTPase